MSDEIVKQEQARAGILLAKSVPVAFLLAFFFGPLGMLYADVKGSLIMIAVSLVVGVLTLGMGLIITWPVTVVWATVAASNYNKKLVETGGQ